MITVRLSGGIGNQMFQYAIGRKISLSRNEQLVLNVSSYKSYSLYKYGLDCYNINCKLSNSQVFYNNKYFRRIVKYFASLGFKRYFKYYIEPRLFVFDKGVLSTKASFLLGSWQSFKYFEDIKIILARDFVINTKKNLKCSSMIDKMCVTESISIHIRRGDYFSDKHSKKVHGILSLEYFYKALCFICNNLKNPIVYIFSDDIKWVKNNFHTKYSIYYIDASYGGPEVSIYMMTKCKHNIISNSTFSWWGAWLNMNSNKIVVAPKIWFRNIPTSVDLLPSNWITL